MSISRVFDEKANTVTLMYNWKPLTPPLKLDDPKQILDSLAVLLDEAYNKLIDAGVE